ncbi:peptide chain release factor N(5)-glutamine methyltransferase, partial [bacterium]|nr:peptide chain release factor N(5)-glutamine methyltransferase [bacterium]
IAHLTGQREFWSLRLAVTEATLVPRPQTELLVELALVCIDADGRRDVLDLGTGSGAIAVAVAAAMRDEGCVSVHAGDWSARAVRAARDNARDNRVDVDVRRSNLFSAFADLEGRVDVLVSNPPYIAQSEAESLPLEVRLGDPKEALFDPDGGTGFHHRIAERGRIFLRPGGMLVLEIGETQGEVVHAILEGLGYEAVVTLPDLTGRDRFVRGRAAGA